MSPADEAELDRLCQMIAAADRLLPPLSPLHEAIKKAALALHLVFLQNARAEIEQRYAELDTPLSEEQQEMLAQKGIPADQNNDSESQTESEEQTD